jgi:hypothetical protein
VTDDLQERIRKRAHQIWEDEGRPEGRADMHWEKARILVAIEDDRTSLVPVQPERPEPAEVMENLGEFPTALTDEGDRRQFPSRKALAEAEPEQAGRGLLSAFKRRRK